jgi:hypothetical protein
MIVAPAHSTYHSDMRAVDQSSNGAGNVVEPIRHCVVILC